MNVRSSFLKFFRSEHFYLIVLPFIAWLFCFKDFLTGTLSLTADAASYWEHINFYTDNLSKGIYPLWNPSWFDGAPYHFFLRRIGDINPFFFLIVILKWLGCPSYYAYVSFVVLYYFLTLIGFYLIARLVFKDKFFAFIAYILLLYSSWSSQLFYNYIILIFLPILWFFYFLLCFYKTKSRGAFLGLCFCLGMVVTTYIPFYFLIIFIVFVLCGIMVYLNECFMFLKNFFSFVRGNKIFVLFCISFLIIASLPAITFYFESKTGDFVLPHRSVGAEAHSAVAVGIENVASGDIINNGSFDKLFQDTSAISIGDFYIPYIFFILLLCGIVGQFNKLIIFLILNIVAITSITVTTALPVHQFLYDHLFFFKFIRNIYYFFWLVILPLGIFLGLASVQSLLISLEHSLLKKKILNYVYISICHVAFSVFLFYQGSLSGGIIVSLTISLIFFFLYIFLKKLPLWVHAFLITLAIVIQSFEVYGYLERNYRSYSSPIGQQALKSRAFEYKRSINLNRLDDNLTKSEDTIKSLQSEIYYSTSWYALLSRFIDSKVLNFYTNNKFIFYDNVVSYQNEQQIYPILQNNMANSLNVALVPQFETHNSDWRLDKTMPLKAELIEQASEKLEVIYFDTNTLVFKTSLDQSKFLVINDNYNSGWQAFINGQKVPILRSNVSFKGLWIPSGKSQITLRFLSPWYYVGHIFIIIFFMAVFIYLILSIKKERLLRFDLSEVKSDV